MTKLERLLSQDGLFIGAHRGYSAKYPENTLLAVKEGIDLGVDVVEVDVYRSRDGVPVIAHDHHLARCSTGSGLISDYTLAELKRLDFGVHRGIQFEGLALPTLEQLLDFMRAYPDVLLDIDFKAYDDTLGTVQSALPLIELSAMMDRCVFNCVDCAIVDYITERYGKRVISAPHDYPGICNYRPGQDGSFKNMWGICIPYAMLSAERVSMYRDLGIAIVCTPADSPEQVRLAMALGVTLPLCDDPREYLCAAGRAHQV